MKNAKVLQISFHGLFLAIMIIMTFIPQIGFISLGPISLTLLHLPVLFGAYMFGWPFGLIYGFVFGFLSFLRALIAPVGVLDPYFVNPIISILPRLIFGLIAGLSFDLAKLIKNKLTNKLTIGIIALLATLIHSVLVLTILGLFNGTEVLAILNSEVADTYATYWLFMGLTVLTNGIPEAIIAFLIVPILALGLNRYPQIETIKNAFKFKKRNKETEELENDHQF